MSTFAELGVSATVCSALEKIGYAAPTEVQARSIPQILTGRDAIIEAETGSGKTAAFAVRAVEVGAAKPKLRVLILVPTRELARQVSEEVRAIGAGSPFRAVAITGGVLEEQEGRQLAGDVRCIIATPGRLLALIEQSRVSLGAVELVILDEADRMLDMGFRTDVEKVLDAATKRTQTLLVSATIPADVKALADRHLKNPVQVRASRAAIPPGLEHYRLNVFAWQKEDATVEILRKELPERAIVFTRTRDRATALAKVLKERGVRADALQGEMSHDQRRHIFDLFQRGITTVLVATDLASRGLDVPEMDLVIQYDLPDDDETYLHRAGRAGRMGKAGRVVTLILPDDKNRRVELEQVSGREWTPYKVELPNKQRPRTEASGTGHQASGGSKGGASQRRGPPRSGGAR